MTLEIIQGTRVSDSSGKKVGRLDALVVDPLSKLVSHVIVRSGVLRPRDRMVPIDAVHHADSHRVDLSEAMRPAGSAHPSSRCVALELGAPVYATGRHMIGSLVGAVTTDYGLMTRLLIDAQTPAPELKAIPTEWLETIASQEIRLAATYQVVDAVQPHTPGGRTDPQ